MSTRERWTVYPLLFLTLGIALRDKMVRPPRVDFEEVVCKRLAATERVIVTDPQGRAQVLIRANPAGGAITTEGTLGVNVTIGHWNNQVGMIFTDRNDKPIFSPFAMQLNATPQSTTPAAGTPPADTQQSPAEKRHEPPRETKPTETKPGEPAATSPPSAPEPAK